MKASCRSSDGGKRDSLTLFRGSWKSSCSARQEVSFWRGQILGSEPDCAGHAGKRGGTKCPAGFSGAQARGRHLELLVCPPAPCAHQDSLEGLAGEELWHRSPKFLHLLQQSESPFEPQFTCSELSSSSVLTTSTLSHLKGEHSKGFQG